MTNLSKQLAEDLTALTGAKFTDKDFAVSNNGISAEQYALLERVVNRSGIRIGVGTSAGMAIADLSEQSEAINIIHDAASEEAARIARLQEALPLLKKKTGVEFKLAKNGKMLVSEEELPSIMPSHDSRQKIARLDDLEKKQIAELEFRMDDSSVNRATVFDADAKRLAMLPDITTATPLGRPAEGGWEKK